MIENTIVEKLHQIAEQHHVKLLYACETGSRGWGFASPDSDYDIRFIYAHPQKKYLSISDFKDTIELMTTEEGGEVLDFSGWDIRKVLQHIKRSNATMFEWLQSPIEYFNAYQLKQDLWTLAQPYFAPQTAINHYLGIMHSTQKTSIVDNHIKIKKYFYILRPLLAAMWAAKYQTPPPIQFKHLLPLVDDEVVLQKINQLLIEKETADEGFVIPIIPEIQAFVQVKQQECRIAASQMSLPVVNAEPLNKYFRQML